MEEFKKMLKDGNREKSLNYILDKLENNETSVVDLYENILLPTSKKLECDLDDKNLCEWKGHVQSSIVRTIIENCYPYVIKSKKVAKNEVAVVLCPPEEHYEIDARIFSDYLLILGYDSIFVGADTPYEDFYNVVSILNPEIVLICVDNYYNVISTKKLIDDIKSKLEKDPIIIVNGNAFELDQNLYKIIQADYYAGNYEELSKVVDIL